jgi:hypothetical protein
MIRLRLAPLVLIAAIAGCDGTSVSNVRRRAFLSGSDLAKELGADALLVEVHGRPWTGADPAEVVGTLRMPEGKARSIRFQGIPPGQGYLGSGKRLLLRFNPPEGSNIRDDCRATAPLPVAEPEPGGFSVNASYCKGSDWLIYARLDASVDAEDWLAYYLAMEELLGTIFRER